MTKHEMTYEGKGKKGKVKTTKKSSVVHRKVRAVKRQVMNVMAIVGIIVVAIWMFQFVVSNL